MSTVIKACGVVALCWVVTGAVARGQKANLETVCVQHPAGDAVRRLFPSPPPPLPADFQPTKLAKKDYLRLIAGNVDFWKHHLDERGAIIDYLEKDEAHPQGMEKQYSTPAFALAAAILAKEAARDDLLEPATRSFSFALTALLNKTTADQHGDFYIPMLMHAHRILKSRVPADVAARWRQQFADIVPENVYQDFNAEGNWNVVNIAGEALRRKDGLVATTQSAAQRDYLDRSFERQQRRFTKFGMYSDPNVPLAYDVFPRLWLEDVIADRAYEGPHRKAVADFLLLGGLSSLLLISPQGEWPGGGRSAHHQWNEAACAVIAECNANKWKAAGRDDIAASFKRMARMCLKSMLRWQRPSGEMWIVKNRAEPQTRLGSETYSHHSQYNLLAAAMLAIAYEHADHGIEERPMPAEYGSYVFDLRDPFTKIVSACGGYYVLIDTAADRRYNATGLQRIHRRGIELSSLSDSACCDRAYVAREDDPRIDLAQGLQWKDGDEWIGLSHFHRADEPPPDARVTQRVVKNVDLKIDPSADRAGLTITYHLGGPGARLVQDRFVVSGKGVNCEQGVGGEGNRFAFPVLVNDGAADTRVSIADNELAVTYAGATMTVRGLNPTMKFCLSEPSVPTHNGYVRAAIAETVRDICRWRVTLEPAGEK